MTRRRNPRLTALLATWLLLVAGMSAPPVAAAAIVPVDSAQALRNALQAAQPGDDIVLAPGLYLFTENLNCSAAGTAQAPIRVRADPPGSATLSFAGAPYKEGFRVSAPHWHFEDLVITGTCDSHSACEHAFHLYGDADHTVIRNNRLIDFNAQIKSNGSLVSGVMVWPDDVLVEGNWFQDTSVRNTGNPVTKIDVVGGRRWIVRGNTLIDFAKGGGNGISYGAFLKGNSRDGLFERNLVVCQRHFSGGVRLGLSLGGGGTGPDSICEDGSCTPEHQNGTLRNNLIVNCNDVGIYLNQASNTQLLNNTLYATSGIDVRFAHSSAVVRNNLLSGRLRNRDGGSHSAAGNRVEVAAESFRAWFVAPDETDFRFRDVRALLGQGVEPLPVVDDFCARTRGGGAADIGAVDYQSGRPCDTTAGGGGNDRRFFSGFDG